MKPSRIVGFFTLVALGLAASLTLIIDHQQQQIQQYAAGSNITFTPTIIPFSAAEIGNPGRGPEYYGGEAPPPNWPITDVYVRPCWKSLEPTQGNYDFSIIEKALTKAKQLGGMGGFRVMSLNTSISGSCVPDYLQTLMPKGWMNGSNYIPDWNDPNYITRGKALFQALAAKYANDPRLGWIDMSLYGNWSEWHTYPLNYPSSTGAVEGTNASLQAIIDFQTQAFPNTRFLMLTANSFALNYAINLQRPNPIGERRDCLGVETLTFNPADLWKTRPIYGEYCGGADFQKGLNDVTNSHISMIGDGEGNLNSFDSYSTNDQNLMTQTYKISGYRYILDNLTIPSSINAGSGFTVTSQWSNVNVAPTYLPWNVMIQFRNGNTIVWQGKSTLDLRTLLPTTNNLTDTPVTITDTMTLPSTIPNGNYTVAVQIVDPNTYYPPLNLAIQGRQADGSYLLGNVSVGGATNITPGVSTVPTLPTTPISTNPNPTNTTTPSPNQEQITTANVSVKLEGIGSSTGENKAPKHTTRNLLITLYNTTTKQLYGNADIVTYDNQNFFTNTKFSLGQAPSGTYKVIVKTNQYLAATLPQNITITAGTPIIINNITLLAGDISPACLGDNQVTATDQTTLQACTTQTTTCTTACPNKLIADLNDDGQVDQTDAALLQKNIGVNGAATDTTLQNVCVQDPKCNGFNMCALKCGLQNIQVTP